MNPNVGLEAEPWTSGAIKSQAQTLPSRPDLNPNNPKDKQVVHDSSLSIYQRLRHFLLINFVLNKRSFILSIFGYIADLVLFIALNLYLFSRKKFIYETICPQLYSPITKDFQTTSTQTINQTITSNISNDTTVKLRRNIEFLTVFNLTNETSNELDLTNQIIIRSQTIKQSYLTLQIISIFVFFICFLLSYLIKLQFKYHRLALNLYDYDVDDLINSTDRDGRDSLASTTTTSHFSSSHHRKFASLLKRFLFRLLTKFASILMHLFFGYQFCQNCFIQQTDEKIDVLTVFTHFFICFCVLFRCLIVFLNKKNSMNKINHLKKLEQKQKELFDPQNSKNPHRYYYYYYYSYLIKTNQNSCSQLKKHQINQNTFRVFLLNEISLFIGFLLSLFHLFSFLKSIEILSMFLPVLFTLVLFRFKSILNAGLNLTILFVSLIITSQLSLPNNFSQQQLKQNNTLINECDTTSSSIFNLTSYNSLTFICFLLTFYFKSLLSIYYCSLSSLERWNLAFLANLSIQWRKLTIYSTFMVYLLFTVSCTVALSLKFKNWEFFLMALFFIVAIFWSFFELLSTINLTLLMNKINDCYLMLNDSSNELNSKNGIANPSVDTNSVSAPTAVANRNSTMTQSTSSQTNNSTKFKLTKFLSRFFSSHSRLFSKGSTNLGAIHMPIHRILSYKGVRNLGSMAYRISICCFVQTLLLYPFAIGSGSLIAIGLFLTGLSLNLIWMNLLYQFCKSTSGNCVAYVLVAPPSLISNFSSTNTANSSMSSNPTLLSGSTKKNRTSTSVSTGSYSTNNSRTINSSISSNTNTSNGINNNTLYFLPFNYQQAIYQRCNLILKKLQLFLQFHLIENFGCDYAANGLNKEYLEHKIKQFFNKKSLDGSAFSTYLLYYCGPTSAQTNNLTFLDDKELSIEEIVNIWKSINCVKSETVEVPNSPDDNKDNNNKPTFILKNNSNNNNSRLIIILDSENTAKNLDYVKSKLNESGVYIALQTCKYNFQLKPQKDEKTLNKLNNDEKLDNAKNKQQIHTIMPQSAITSQINIGKFTLDWIKSNSCNSYNMNTGYEIDDVNVNERYYNVFNGNFDENRGILNEDDEEDDEDEEMSDEMELEAKEIETIQKKKNIPETKHETNEPTVFYETKCAFSRYWINFAFDRHDKNVTSDFGQLWGSYYPSWICRLLIKIINFRLCYLRINFIRRVWFFLRRLKNRVIPIHEYDTGHGFKLFSS